MVLHVVRIHRKVLGCAVGWYVKEIHRLSD